MVRPAVVASLVVLVLLAPGCTGDEASDDLPSWLPAELAGLTIAPASDSDLSSPADEAVSAVRQRVFPFGGPEQEPETFPTLITGPVTPSGPIEVAPDGQVELPKVKDKPAWLVVWRGIPKNLRDAPDNRNAGNDELIDFVAFVDPETGQLLGNVSLAGTARLT